MKVSDIHKAFKVIMDKNSEAVAFGGCPAFLPEEIDLFLNQAFLEVVFNKFTGLNTLRIPFEGSVKRIADLQKLITTAYGLPASLDSSSNVLTVEDVDSDDKMLYVDTVLHFDDKQAKCKLIDHSTSELFKKTYCNDPWIEIPVIVHEGDKLKIFIDVHSMTGNYTVDYTYVKRPTVISYTNANQEIDEVPDNVMMEIINRAVVIALENIESQRTSGKEQLNNLSE